MRTRSRDRVGGVRDLVGRCTAQSADEFGDAVETVEVRLAPIPTMAHESSPFTEAQPPLATRRIRSRLPGAGREAHLRATPSGSGASLPGGPGVTWCRTAEDAALAKSFHSKVRMI